MEIDHLILCPLKKEWTLAEVALAALQIESRRVQNKGRWHIEIPSWKAALCVGGHGKTQFGLQTQYWIHQFPNIAQVVVIGAAGGLLPTLPVGSLLSVTEIVEHDYKVKFIPHSKAPRFVTNNQEWSSQKSTISCLDGVLASGDEDIVDPQRALNLVQETGAVAVAWESAGGVRAAQFNGLSYFEFRGITDSTSQRAVTEFQTHLNQCMANLVKLLQQFFEK